MGKNTDRNLVSVLILAYNAEKYIRDLLESIRDQTYQNIEIIISDDASKDDTVRIAQVWKDENRLCLKKMMIRSSEQNQGVVKNANLGFELCNGRYIKVIAADDKLAPACIENMVRVCEDKGYPLLLGKMQSFYQGDDLQDMPVNYEFYDMNAEEQYKHLLQVNECAAPTALYRKDFLKEMDWFDENYPAMEDYPFWLKITEKGVRIPFMNETVVYYRRNDSSVTSTTGTKMVGESYFKSYKKFFYDRKIKPMAEYHYYRDICRECKEFLYKDLLLFCGNKRGSRATRLLTRIFYGK